MMFMATSGTAMINRAAPSIPLFFGNAAAQKSGNATITSTDTQRTRLREKGLGLAMTRIQKASPAICRMRNGMSKELFPAGVLNKALFWHESPAMLVGVEDGAGRINHGGA